MEYHTFIHLSLLWVQDLLMNINFLKYELQELYKQVEYTIHLVNWNYIVTCNKCGFISSEKLSEENAKRLLHAHVGGPQNCTTGHIKLMKVRA